MAIAAVAAGLLAVVLPVLAIPIFAASIGVIYLRGYIVPGTPTLTKRYLPDGVLRWFDKEPDVEVDLGADTTLDEDLDPEATLLGVGALELDETGDDLRAPPEFAERWREHAERLRDDSAVREELATLLDVDSDHVSLRARGQSFVATVDGEQIGRWPSRAALIADVAGDAALRDSTTEWADLPLERRSALLGSLRVFLEECPECRGTVTLDEATRESCCRSWDVFTVSCDSCGSRLFEIEAAEVNVG